MEAYEKTWNEFATKILEGIGDCLLSNQRRIFTEFHQSKKTLKVFSQVLLPNKKMVYERKWCSGTMLANIFL